MDGNEGEASALAFDGNWREFAPIALTNLLLSIVTLGLYSFWARTRERQYLWRRTRFIDARLEWTGTGLELLIGYAMAILLFFLPLGLLQFVVQGLAIRGQEELAGLLVVLLYLLGLYLVGVARFRALRYRLSRSFWHGIRGGSDAAGFGYGLSYLWKTLVGGVAAGLMIPWSMVSLWNDRWNKMSFGPHPFQSEAVVGGLIGRFLLFYLAPIVVVLAAAVAAAFLVDGRSVAAPGPESVLLGAALVYLLFFVVLGLVAVGFYAAFFRQAVGALSLGELRFAFTARSMDWFRLLLVDLALVVCTLGIGAIFLGYRHWAFFIRHLEAYGAIDLDTLTQSPTRAPGQGEGLLDAFDVGAF
jgi:uncharacterized membrane protein YjgN (DUF898 family)